MFIDSFQEKIWKDKYQYNNETFNQFCKRIASTIFVDDDADRDKLTKYLKNFEVLFGGRINANAGISEQGLTLFNCFIMSIRGGGDSLENILESMSRYTLTLKTEGGVGFCANYLRPAGTLIKKIGVTTPGSIKFLEGYDKLSEIITAGNVNSSNSFQGVPTKNSIRKGATMVTMSVCHPDIEDFITAKSVPNRLTKMNMSVLITDAFMYAVENKLDWDLWFPDIKFEKYDTEWDGNFEKWAEKGYPFVVYKTIEAEALWNLLLKNSFSRNEPGIIFIDTVRNMNNLFYLTKSDILSPNPCSEIFGTTGVVDIDGEEKLVSDVCCLGSINIVKFYDVSTKKFDMDKFLDAAALMVKSLDNIIDISDFPLDEYKDGAYMKRKIGVGITGIGSLMMMMNTRYGSEKCLVFLEELMHKFMNKLYVTSAMLAEEKGPFPLYNKKILSGGYIKNSGVLTDDTINMIKKHGLRNSALCAFAPNGSLSILAGNVSGGLEPVFSKEHIRWNRVEGLSMPFVYPDVQKNEWFETDYFKESSVSGEKVLMSTDKVYRVDKNNGLCKRELIQDYGYKIAKENNFSEVAGAMELSIDEHLSVLSLISRFVDQSSSKTINIPNETLFEDFKELYGKIHKYGVKGCTTYREGTSVAILETTKKEKEKTVKQQQKEFLDAFKEQENGDVVTANVKLPEQYPSLGYILRSEGKKWYVHVAFKDKRCTKPFAIFVNTNHGEDGVLTYAALEKMEEIAIAKGLKTEFIESTKRKYAYQKNPVKICRMLGFLLRHNVDVYTIIKGLDELEGATPGTFVHRIKKFLGQFVTSIKEAALCPECNEKAIVFESGCYICKNCGASKC